jgi:hypothetical protein
MAPPSYIQNFRKKTALICDMVASLNKTSRLASKESGVYMVFGAIAFIVHHLYANGQFSSILTLSAIFQCLAFSLLAMQVLSTGKVSGISAETLKLDAFALGCRLSSTTWLHGYLPLDATGDYLYQCFDILSLVMVLWLLYRVLAVQHQTYNVDDDNLHARPFAVVCLVLAAFLHGNLDERPIFDTLWLCGLFGSAISVVPQLWVMTHSGKSVPALTGHFVAVMAVARIVSGTYMYVVFEEIECYPWVGKFNHTGYSILAAHAVHLILLGDFAYYYFKNLATKGVDAPLNLSLCWEV